MADGPLIDFRPILFIVGILLTTLAIAMCAPGIADAAVDNPDWKVFAGSAGVTLFIGVTLMLTNWTARGRFTIRQAFLMAALSWVVMTAFAALPFLFADLGMSFTDAFFEAMSGITTTGSTVMTGLDGAPDGILLWRSLLQWLGGVGIIVLAVSVLPALSVGGMQLFRVEAFDATDKVLPRATQIAGGITVIYIALTVIWSLALWVAGMNGLEAVSHAMTTIATGGFSTSDQSVGLFQNEKIEMIIIVGMLIGSMPFLLYLRAIRGAPAALLRDSQVQWFLAIAAGSVAVVFAWLWLGEGVALPKAALDSAFNVISIMTGTGYTSTDFQSWGSFPIAMMFFLMFVGGCAGSTACGIKIFRFQVLYATAQAQIRRLLQPHGVFFPHYNHRPISDDVVVAVMSFFFLFVAIFAILAAALGALGLDFITAVSGAATAICNVGPALGPIIGPAGNFSALPDSAKWVLAIGMLLGRLELFTVLVLFAPSFWRG